MKFVIIVIILAVIFGEIICQKKEAEDVFLCSIKDLIFKSNFCDGTVHCRDGSDEMLWNIPEVYDPVNKTIRCKNIFNDVPLYCSLPQHWLCIGTIECEGVTPCDAFCANHYKCQVTNVCVLRDTMCDQNTCNDCPEDYESDVGIGFKCRRYGEMCVLPQQLLLDDVTDCDGGLDLCYRRKRGIKQDTTYDVRLNDDYEFNNKLCFLCFDGTVIIPRSRVCDGVFDCSDLSDECLCHFSKPSVCSQIFREMVEEDEMPPDNMQTNTCRYGSLICNDGYCTNRENVCNGYAECASGEDELLQYCQGTLICDLSLYIPALTTCRCTSMHDPCRSIMATTCDDHFECASSIDECMVACLQSNNENRMPCGLMGMDIPDEGAMSLIDCTTSYPLTDLSVEMPPINNLNATEYFTWVTWSRCDGYLLCDIGWQDEIGCLGMTPCTNAAKGRVSVSNDNVCDGVLDCDSGSDEDRDLCGKSRYYCSAYGGRSISIVAENVCDYSIECDNAEDELHCNDTRFYCEDGKMPIFVRKEQISDGFQDCEDWSDECPSDSSLRNDNVLSSRFHMIGNPVLRYLIWIMGLTSVAGNAAVVATELKYLQKLTIQSGSLYANRCMVVNLAVSDFLMGVYLISVAGVGLKFQV